jgi:hypothetical protein
VLQAAESQAKSVADSRSHGRPVAAGDVTDLSGYGRADLTFGADGEDGTDGILLYLPSNSTGLGYTDTVVHSKSTLGTPTDARLGRTLTP